MATYEISDSTVPTTLNGTLTAGTLSITVTDGASYPTANFIILVEAEEIDVQSRSSNVLTVRSGGRGYGDTSASTHADSLAVTHVLTNQDLPFRRTQGSTAWEAQGGISTTGTQALATSTIRNIVAGTTQPGTPTTGDIWLDIS